MSDETKFYEYEGSPAYWRGGAIRRVTRTGEVRVEEIVKFMHEATKITEAEYDARVAKLSAN